MIQNKKNLFIIILILIVIGLGVLSLSLKDTKSYPKNNLSEQKQKINENKQTYDLSLLQGKWKSIDDTKSVIEFSANKKIDYYSDNKISEGDFSVKKGLLIVKEDTEVFKYQIVTLSNNILTLTYLPRGNTLKYERIQKVGSRR